MRKTFRRTSKQLLNYQSICYRKPRQYKHRDIQARRILFQTTQFPSRALHTPIHPRSLPKIMSRYVLCLKFSFELCDNGNWENKLAIYFYLTRVSFSLHVPGTEHALGCFGQKFFTQHLLTCRDIQNWNFDNH